SPGWAGLGRVALFMLGGLVLALVLGVIDQWRRRQRFGGGPAALLLFLLLEYPMLVYAGVILGLFAGAVAERDPDLPKAVLTYCALGGGILGYALAELRQVKDNYYRLAATLLAAAAGVGGGYWWLQQQPFFAELDRTMLGVQ